MEAAGALLTSSADTELLVVGSRGHGSIESLHVGSVADGCVRHAAVPVVVVRPDAVEHVGGGTVVGVDGSEASLEALRWARREAHIRGSRLSVLHAWHLGYTTELEVMAGVDDAELEADAKALVEHAVDATASLGGPEPELTLVHDVAAGALLDASKQAEVLVVGARGRGGCAGLLLGSVSRRCLHGATCPLVVVHARPSAGEGR